MRLGDFAVYRDLLLQESGVDINPEKTYLLESRLTPVVHKWGYPTIESMTLALRAVPDPELIHDVVQAMTQTETWFFRDKHNFEALQHVVVPYLMKQRKRKKTLNIWSAGCSTGQEVWSIAMSMVRAYEGHKGWKYHITATDISNEAVEYAERAIYNRHESQSETSIHDLIRFFEQSRMGWNVKQELKNCVDFRISNLLHESEDMGPQDIIFCCNVIDDFSPESRARIFETFSYHLPEDGFLFIGSEDKWQNESPMFTTLPGYPSILIRADGDYKYSDFPKMPEKETA